MVLLSAMFLSIVIKSSRRLLQFSRNYFDIPPTPWSGFTTYPLFEDFRILIMDLCTRGILRNPDFLCHSRALLKKSPAGNLSPAGGGWGEESMLCQSIALGSSNPNRLSKFLKLGKFIKLFKPGLHSFHECMTYLNPFT